MDIEKLRKRLIVCENSTTGLRWNEDIVAGVHGQIPVAFKGDVAGSWSAISYYEVGVFGKSYWVHRLIWILLHGSIDNKKSVDHIDGNGLNNNPSNLRLVTHKTNLQNLKKSILNTSGITGVCLTSDGYWKASWNDGGKSLGKKFSIRKYGNDNAFNMAVDFRQKIIKSLNESGQNYTERHGL